MPKDTGQLVALIYNDSRMVREYERGGRTSIGRLKRQQAILKLGLTVQHAFSVSKDYETLLSALVDGLRPRNEQPF